MAQERVAPTAPQRQASETRLLNAQQVTSIAVGFLKSLGHKRRIHPKRVFVENQRYVVEVEIGKKILARVQIDMATSEIKEYAIEKKTEEPPLTLPVEPKAIIIMFAISAVVTLIFAIIGLPDAVSGLI